MLIPYTVAAFLREQKKPVLLSSILKIHTHVGVSEFGRYKDYMNMLVDYRANPDACLMLMGTALHLFASVNSMVADRIWQNIEVDRDPLLKPEFKHVKYTEPPPPPADDTLALMLAEMRKQTQLLEEQKELLEKIWLSDS